MSTRIGNDVIDLRAAHNRGRAGHARLLARVLTANERAQLLADDGGDAVFALLWSAKEAAYKALKKARPTLVFAPGRWQVDCVSLRMTDATCHGHVQMDADTRVAVSWQRQPHWLHCVATFGPTPEQLDSAVCTLAESAPQRPFSAAELASFSRTESAHVRELARQLLAASLGLFAFLGLTGFALDRAFTETAQSNLRERLKSYAYAYFGGMDFTRGKVLLP